MKIKNLFIISGLAAILLVLGVSFYFWQQDKTLLNIASREEEFKPLISDYTALAEFYYDDFRKSGESVIIYDTPRSDSDHVSRSMINGQEHCLRFTDELHDSYIRVRDSYYLDKHSLAYVCVYDGFAAFVNEGMRASYVYSVNGEKPEYITSPDTPQDDPVVAKDLGGSWYWVCRKW